ncbi:response regulator transcription factor [Agromyces sp. NPDC060279]|uniref:helix-turn-helix transcriptional regulator n=1 Tax=Agromyces sp. NPDC060279 TaxID=3347092 RepID=UPI003665DC3A
MIAASTRRALDEVLDVLHDERDELVLRGRLASPLMRLLGADYLASYVRDSAAAPYRARVAVNMSDGNLRRYEQYYQFHDPVTPVMAHRQRAAIVDRTIERRTLERTEFYTDFLMADGLHHGINFFAIRRGATLGDLRLWRGRSAPPFGDEERVLLDLVGAAFRARLALAQHPPSALPEALATPLTAREREIALALVDGATDRELCARFRISYGTVRTHLGHIFDKWGVSSRLGAIAAARRGIGESTDP